MSTCPTSDRSRRSGSSSRGGAGGRRVGWKLGGDIAEVEAVTGGRPAVGHLTSATLLADGDAYAAGGRALHADTELVVVLGQDGEIAAAGVALEIVDPARPPDDLEASWPATCSTAPSRSGR